MPTDFRISDLPTSIPFNNLDLMEVSQVDSQSPSGYSSVKKTMEEIGEKLLNDIQYSSALATTNKKVIPAINEVNSAIPANSDFSLSGLSDTAITTPSSGQVLSYDGGKWKNSDIVKNKIGQSYIVCILAGANESGFRIQFPSNSRFTILVQDINGRVTSVVKKTSSQPTITDIASSYLATAIDSTNVYLRSGEWDIATFIISSFEDVENITVASYT